MRKSLTVNLVPHSLGEKWCSKRSIVSKGGAGRDIAGESENGHAIGGRATWGEIAEKGCGSSYRGKNGRYTPHACS